MGHRLPGYNAKARQSSLKKKDRHKKKSKVAIDTNREVIDVHTIEEPQIPLADVSFDEPQVNPEFAAELNQLIEENKVEGHISSKKRKRLEKYVEKSLARDERVKLLKRLSESSVHSDLFRSSKALGIKKESLREQLRRGLMEERAGLPQSNPSLSLVKATEVVGEPSFPPPADSTRAVEVTFEDGSKSKQQNQLTTKVCLQSITVGSALKKKSAAKNDINVDAKKEVAYVEAARLPSEHSLSDVSENERDNSDGDSIQEQTATNDAEFIHPPQEHVRDAPEEFTTAQQVGATDQSDNETKKAFYVLLQRSEEVISARMGLPILAEEHAIMETISENAVTVLCGATGSGKTTQLPQFLYESGFGHPGSEFPGKIGITQPRRVAAVSMAHRVGYEMGLPDVVSYQIRYEGTINNRTAIKFMTDGVLLKEVSRDFLLTEYSCIIIDEAHERSLNTDILIGLLSRIVKLRERIAKDPTNSKYADLTKGKTITPLKVVIMSATLRVEDFTNNRVLFPTVPPVINVEGRQYPVTMHFAKRTPDFDYVTAAYKKVCKIHARLPAGGILVFLSGQNEVNTLCRKLRKRFSLKSNLATENNFQLDICRPKADDCPPGMDNDDYDVTESGEVVDDNDKNDQDLALSEDESEDDEMSLGGEEEDLEDQPMLVLPLYSLLPTKEQLRVFDNHPENVRLCVVATNVAETSLTIPNIKYVVDSGKVKERKYDPRTGVASFEIGWTSKASADQRMGRAGRSGPGHCYRLFSSAVFDHYFEKFSKPEIQRMPIEGIVLQMKSMNIENVVNFPYPTPPDRDQLASAETLLVTLGALDVKRKQITELGRLMARVPLAPRLAKMFFVGLQMGIAVHTIALISCLAAGDPFVRDTNLDEDKVQDDEQESDEQKSFGATQKMFADQTGSDLIKLVNVFRLYLKAENIDSFCDKYYLRPKIMKESQQMKDHLFRLLPELGYEDIEIGPHIPSLDTQAIDALKEVILSGYIDQTAVKKTGKGYSQTKTMPYEMLVASMTSSVLNEELFIHPSSCLFYTAAPELVVYQEIMQTSKLYMKGLTVIRDPSALARIGPALCTFSKPLDSPAPRYCSRTDELVCFSRPRFGDRSLELNPIQIPFPEGVDHTRLLAKCFLEGSLFPWMKPFADHMVCKPSLMTNNKMPLTHSKILSLVQPLLNKNIQNRADIERVWLTEPKFLLNAYLTWIPPTFHSTVAEKWPLKE